MTTQTDALALLVSDAERDFRQTIDAAVREAREAEQAFRHLAQELGKWQRGQEAIVSDPVRYARDVTEALDAIATQRRVVLALTAAQRVIEKEDES